MINWINLPFSELSTKQLYELLQLRVDVFVVEQQCAYSELDGKDTIEGAQHLLGYQNDELVACARLLPAGCNFDNPSIGRVISRSNVRGSGIGHQLIQQAIMQCHTLWPEQDIDISAQQHLVLFYAQHGFEITSEPYLEDGIPHQDMRRAK